MVGLVLLSLKHHLQNVRGSKEASLGRSNQGWGQEPLQKAEWRREEAVWPLVSVHRIDPGHQEKPHWLICIHKLECVRICEKSVNTSCK